MSFVRPGVSNGGNQSAIVAKYSGVKGERKTMSKIIQWLRGLYRSRRSPVRVVRSKVSDSGTGPETLGVAKEYASILSEIYKEAGE